MYKNSLQKKTYIQVLVMSLGQIYCLTENRKVVRDVVNVLSTLYCYLMELCFWKFDTTCTPKFIKTIPPVPGVEKTHPPT